jgi:hypothetical protein
MGEPNERQMIECDGVEKTRKKGLQNAIKTTSHDEGVQTPEIKQIDNRASGTPEMKYQYFELCQLAKYPNIEIKIVENTEAQVFFDGNYVDAFDIKETIMGIVQENILTMKEVERKKQKLEKKKEKS